MSAGNLPAFPSTEYAGGSTSHVHDQYFGMNKREYIVTRLMAAHSVSQGRAVTRGDAMECVRLADIIIEECAK